MIGAEMKARFDALPDADKARIVDVALTPLRGAMDSFARGEIDERALIAIEMAVNVALGDLLPAEVYVEMRCKADNALRERLAELDAAAS